MSNPCVHLDQVTDVAPAAQGCLECLDAGSQWVHLRMCMTCGHIGCCDQSPGRHATAHYHSTTHPLIQSFEPAEDWWWCYVDELGFFVDEAPRFAHG